MVERKFFSRAVHSLVAVPVLRSGELAYLFCLGSDSGHRYGDDDVSLAKLVISQAALLFEREKALLNGTVYSPWEHDLRDFA